MIGSLPPPETVKKLLHYNPETGQLFWKQRGRDFFKSERDWKIWNTKNANKEAFLSRNSHGYVKGSIFDRTLIAHRVIWAIQTGEWPEHEIDHINRQRADNRWINLREATSSQNKTNVSSRQNSSSKYIGVSWCETRKIWQASIRKAEKKKHLGRFSCEIDAAKAYDAAAQIIHGQFANLNFPERTAA
jgi:hypothetical protein